MTKSEMVKNIRIRLKEDYGLEASKELVNKILDIEADEIYMVMAQNDSYKYIWGTISGIEKPPIKVSGALRNYTGIIKNHGWSFWKTGCPNIKWSRIAELCEKRSPEEYFELPEHRYTSKAREFREDAGLPEIPEYADLPEEKIIELCKKADNIEFEALPKDKQRRKRLDKESNRKKVLGSHMLWEKEGYIPVGAISKDYKGKSLDVIDLLIERDNVEEIPLPERLDKIRAIKDIANSKGILDIHPEVEEIENELILKIKEEGLEEITHVAFDYNLIESGKWYMGERDPWGFKFKKKLKKEREIEKSQQYSEFINNLDNVPRESVEYSLNIINNSDDDN